MDISIIVPVYNGERTLDELCRRINETLAGRYSFEIIFIHDCGQDGSLDVIRRLERENSGIVKGFSLSRNVGQHNAILRGIPEASGNFIITLDEDLQHDPEIIPVLIDKQAEVGSDVVYARFRKLKHPGMRIRMSEMLRSVLPGMVPGLYPGYSPFRLIKSETARKIINSGNGYTFIDAYLARVTDKFASVDSEHHRRADGESSYTYFKLFRHAMLIAICHSPYLKWLKPLVRSSDNAVFKQ